jgi:glycosyltransferase involved in cell wall biosynthesis
MRNTFGLFILGTLLFSPALFKVQVSPGIVVHPLIPVLALAWCWVLAELFEAMRKTRRGFYMAEWQSWNVPMILIALLLGGLALSLAINSIRLRSFQSLGWLFILKWLLYLAPLPLAALLAIRTGQQVVKLVSWLVPLVGLATVLYSFYRLRNGIGLQLPNYYVGSSPTYQALGMLGEIWTPDGLQVRTDTVSQGAYGVYLVLVCLFSLTMGLFRGWDGIVPVRYAIGQAVIIVPFALMGILFTGSRTSLLMLAGCLGILFSLAIVNPRRVLDQASRLSFLSGFLILILAILAANIFWRPLIPTLDRLTETIYTAHTITSDYAVSPASEDVKTRAVLRNVQTRFWLWKQVIGYLYQHPMVLLIGVGYDRKIFLENVVGLPFTPINAQYQTAHSLLLDILIKGGLFPAILLVLLCGWLFWAAVMGIIVPRVLRQDSARIGLAWMLLSFWPPFFLINLSGEEMFTDNILLHWCTLAGLLLGLCAVTLRQWLSGHIAHLTPTATIGGGPVYITTLAKYQMQRGAVVRVFSSDEEPFVTIWRSMGLEVNVFPMRRPSLSSIVRLMRSFLDRPAVIHAHGRGAAFFALWVKLLMRVPVLYTPHGQHYARERGWRYVGAWLFELWFRVVFDSIFYVSEGERTLARKHGIPLRRSRVIVSGVRVEVAQDVMNGGTKEPLLRELAIPQGRPVIGWIGSLHYGKGIDILLKSVPLVRTEIPDAVWVVIGGGDPKLVNHYRRVVTDEGLSNCVYLLGECLDAHRFIPVFDIFISTSRGEGLPLTLLEVMACGVPIVASDVVGNRDVLAGWGCLFSPDNAVAAGQAQIRLLADAEFQRHLSDEGLRMLNRRFSLDRMFTELDRAYHETLGEIITT